MSAVYFVKAAACGVSPADTVASALLAGGLEADTPVALIEWALIAQALRTKTTLGGLSRAMAAGADGPALVLVGETPGAHDAPRAAQDDEGVDGEDAFTTYGRSWFR
ncbi:MAG: hypothetical protein ACYCTF_12700 [Acidiferrobacter sp.]